MRREMIAHFLGATGGVCALLALLAVFDQAWEQVYCWLGFALILQAAGSEDAALLAFPAFVDQNDPECDEQHVPIDEIGGFLASVFVPVVAMLHAGFLDGWAGAAVGCMIVLSALYRLAYMANHPNQPATRFLGLPAAWSIIGFYLHAFDATPLAAVLAIGLGIILSLVPINWPKPLNSERWPFFTRALVVVWLATATYTLAHGFQVPIWGTKAVLIGIAVYGLLLAALLAMEPTSGTAEK